jgi:hypothetical protein
VVREELRGANCEGREQLPLANLQLLLLACRCPVPYSSDKIENHELNQRRLDGVHVLGERTMKTYTFHVSLPGTGKVWRKIEIGAEQTLEDLHHAIQAAYEWDADHLYSFFMNNKAWDPASEYTLPEGALFEGLEIEEADDVYEEDEDDDEVEGSTFSLEDWRAMSEKDQEDLVKEFTRDTGLPAAFFHDMIDELQRMEQNPDLFEEEEIRDVRTTPIDSLSLTKGKEFMYIFDYGDEHRFRVKVDSIDDNADSTGAYPRIVESVGDAPEQYPGWEDEDWDEIEK